MKETSLQRFKRIAKIIAEKDPSFVSEQDFEFWRTFNYLKREPAHDDETYALKWEIEMSDMYREQMLNMMAQGYLAELWELIQINLITASDIFIKECNDIQFKFMADNIELLGTDEN